MVVGWRSLASPLGPTGECRHLSREDVAVEPPALVNPTELMHPAGGRGWLRRPLGFGTVEHVDVPGRSIAQLQHLRVGFHELAAAVPVPAHPWIREACRGLPDGRLGVRSEDWHPNGI